MVSVMIIFCPCDTHSLRPELQLDLDSITKVNSSETFTLGSIVTLEEWHHLAINVLPCNMQPTYEVCRHLQSPTVLLFV